MILLIGLAAAGILAVLLLEVLIRDTRFGLVAVAAWYVVASGGAIELETTLAGFNVRVQDGLFTLLLAAAVARLLRQPELPMAHVWVVGFGLVAMASLAFGVLEFGPQSPVVEFRRYLYLVAGTLYVATEPPRREFTDVVARVWVWTGAAILGLAVLRWGGNAAGMTGGWFGTADDLRVVPSDDALFLLQVGVLVAMGRWARQERFGPRWYAVALLLAVGVLQHRTVWMGALAVGLVWALRNVDLSRAATAALIVVAVTGSALSVASLQAADLQDVEEELAGTAASLGTFRWRVEGWGALVQQAGPRDGLEQVLGRPFGSGWDRRQRSGVVEVSPHNFYLEAYLRTGLLGLGLLLAWHGVPMWRLARRHRLDGALSPETHLLMLVALPVYYITYAPDPMQGLLLGVAVARAAWGPEGEHADEVGRPQRSPVVTTSSTSARTMDSEPHR